LEGPNDVVKMTSEMEQAMMSYFEADDVDDDDRFLPRLGT
jgi:hypothetical protein